MQTRITKIDNDMHNARTREEIEKSLSDYPLIPMDEIDPEARLIAVRWVEGYEPGGFDLPNKHKLASDIMNYARKRSDFEKFFIESVKENEEIHGKIEEVGKGDWISVKSSLPPNRTYVMIYSVNGYDIAEFKHGCFYIGLDRADITHWQPLPPPPTK